MSTLLGARPLRTRLKEYSSGEVVEPGVYIDVETGAIIKVKEQDELPEGSRVVRYRRRFRRIDDSLLDAD